MSEYRVGQMVRMTSLDDRGFDDEHLTIGATYQIIEADFGSEKYPVAVYTHAGEKHWLTRGTFELVTDDKESDSSTNPFGSINSKSLSHLFDLAGQLVAAYDDCDESTKQLLGEFMVKIGGIEVKRES